MTDIAILHDRVPQLGGGEHVAIEAARVLDAPLFTMYVAGGVDLPSDITVHELKPDKYTRGLSKYALEWKNAGMNPLETLAVQLDMTDADLGGYDTVLSSAPLSKAYVPETGQRVVHYPHSPPRWLYDLYRDRMAGFDYPLVGSIVRLYAEAHRSFDQARNAYVDTFVANSEVVAERIERFYGRESAVVYPPVTGDWRNDGDEGYFVTWSRLSPEKRIPMICEAFSELDTELVVAGDGQQRKQVERYARENANIDYRGYVEDIESLVAKATAVVYAPTAEDFGLVGAEALTAGKPLIGVDEGFTAEMVEEMITGKHCQPTVEGIRKTVQRFDPKHFDTRVIQQYADRYSREKFAEGLRAVVEP